MSNSLNKFAAAFKRLLAEDGVRHDPKLSTQVDKAVAIKDETKRLKGFSAVLANALDELDDRQWQVGDALLAYRAAYEALDQKPPSYKKIASAISTRGWQHAWLARLCQVASYYSCKARIDAWPWFTHYERMRIELKRTEDVRMSAEEIKVAIEKDGADPNDNRKITQKGNLRKIKAHQQRKRRQSEGKIRRCKYARIVNKLHHSDYAIVASKIPHKEISVIYADPPFGRIGNYFSTKSCQSSAQQALGYECDNPNPKEAMAVNSAAIRFD